MATISFQGDDKPTPCPGWTQQNNCGNTGPKGRIPGVWRHDLCTKCAAKFCKAIRDERQRQLDARAKISGPLGPHGLGF